jgi:hypothetical protein
MLAPATRLTLEEEAFKLKLVATGTLGPEIVIIWLVWLRVMLFPPTKVNPPEVILVVTPAVFPLEICKELSTVELFVAWTVIVLALLLRDIPAPAIRDTLEELPFNEKLVATGTAGPIMVIVGLVED